jgi:hypothetical protein
MKKLLAVVLAGLVSACACFDCQSDDPVVRIKEAANTKLDCDYFDGRTCYRYVYKKSSKPTAMPKPIRYRKCQNKQSVCNTCNSCNSCNSCESNASETREPVEVVYKKTTYKTVCDPKTVSEVTYETLPYDKYELENN